MASPKASWESVWQRNLTKSPSAKFCTVYPMRKFLALLFAVLALSGASPAIACSPGTHPCGPGCCEGE
jgi:hypothetical protein